VTPQGGLRRRHTLCVAAVVALLCVVELLLLDSMRQISATTRMFGDGTQATTTLADAERAVLVLRTDALVARGAPGRRTLELRRGLLERHLLALGGTEMGRRHFDRARIAALLRPFDDALRQAGDRPETRRAVMVAALGRAEQGIRRVARAEESALYDAVEDAMTRRERAERLVMAVGLAGLVLAVCVALVLRRSIRGDFRRAYHQLAEEMEQRRALEGRLWHQALHDPLTDLPNRENVRGTLRGSLAGGRPVGVLFLDLDGFKVVNDAFGHDVGDDLLRMVAERLRRRLRSGDILARLGGDEFCVLLCDCPSEEAALDTAERLVEALSGPFAVAGHQAHVGASIGVAYAGAGGGATVDGLMRDADLAMYAAKQDGKNAARAFDAPLRARTGERRALVEDLRAALEGDDDEQLVLHHQPIVELAGLRVQGFEALVRWRHPERGMLPPGEFIAASDEHGLAAPLGHWVLRTACRDAAAWGPTPAGDLPWVSVNLSPVQVHDPRLPEHVQEALEAAGLAPARLVLELSERAVLRDAQRAVRTLETLRALGVRLALDDFGAGYSSLSYLRFLPIDILKIDRSFVTGLHTDRARRRLTRAVVDLARSAELCAVAEGIETPGELEAVRAMGCTMGQGFLLGRPAPVAEATRVLAPAVRS
jgi:diguanylate cyclase (GGDEF)-like protein